MISSHLQQGNYTRIQLRYSRTRGGGASRECHATCSLPHSFRHHLAKEHQHRTLGGSDFRLQRSLPVGQGRPAQLHKLGPRRASRQQRTTPEQDAGTRSAFRFMLLSSICSPSDYFTVALQGNCVVMFHENRQKKTGMWASRACEMESHGFICQRQQGVIITYYHSNLISMCNNKKCVF